VKTHTAADANLLNHMLKFSSAQTTKGSSLNRSVEGCREKMTSLPSLLFLYFLFPNWSGFQGMSKETKCFFHQAWHGTVRSVHFTHSSLYSIFIPLTQQQCFLNLTVNLTETMKSKIKPSLLEEKVLSALRIWNP